MDTQTVAAPSGVFDFLGLPSELRNRIYQLHLSSEGLVQCHQNGYEGLEVMDYLKPRLGINILAVCRQIYHEAVAFAYADCMWDMGPLSLGTSLRLVEKYAIHCAERLACIPFDKVQHLRMNIIFETQGPIPSVLSIAMSDLTKLKSLRSLEVFVFAGSTYNLVPVWLRDRGVTYRDSPLLIGLICQVLSQTPRQVKVVWTSALSGWEQRNAVKMDADMAHIAHKFDAIKGCGRSTNPVSAAPI